MLISLALVLICTTCGVIVTYLYDHNASLPVRICTGACTGLAALGLVGFVLASVIGLNTLSIALTVFLLVLIAVSAIRDRERREACRSQLKQSSQAIQRGLLHLTKISPLVPFYLIVAVVLWRVFNRGVIEDLTGLSTGVLNNFGDLPFHLSVITSFVFGNNFPPEDPTYAGVKFTYPFLTDFISAIFVQCGASLRQSMLLENFVLALSLVGLIHRWAWELLRDRLAAVLTPLLVLLNGGFGFVLLFTRAQANEQGLYGILKDLPPSFTIIPETAWRWGNAISTLLIPQRGILLGLALAVIVFTQWWLADGDGEKEVAGGEAKGHRKKGRRDNPNRKEPAPSVGWRKYLDSSVKRMIAAGVVAGLLPLVHAHSFVVVMSMAGCIALLRRRWASWIAFFVVASVIAIPQMVWSTVGSAVDAKEFFEWQFGWDRGKENTVWFWFKNTGLFIPVLLVAILWRGKEYLVSRKLLAFYLPFLLCFIVPNLMKMAPWVWDNIKVLFYWWLASAPLVAAVLARMWRQQIATRVLAMVLFVALTLAGALDVAAIALRSNQYGVFDRNGMSFAELIKSRTAPRAMIVHAPVHNTPVFLTGRRSLMGYPGHIWTHGLEFAEREAHIKRIYAGGPDAKSLIEKYQADYLVVGPQERSIMPVNQQYVTNYQKVGEVGEYRLFKVR